MKPVKVLILIGSDSDAPVMSGALQVLEELGVPAEMTVASAHRSPSRVERLVSEAPDRGVQVFIAAAGAAAHLGGVIAARTTRPVIGVPIDSSPLAGFDALLSTVQMPPGIPVATVSVGKAGATNAAVLAAQIVALSDRAVAAALVAYKEKLAAKVEDAARRVEGSGTGAT
ncbi:MAG: 5-(carboxyamino)imidazole ribonucleotide mutase [Acidobacteria bacterium]|nr:MAG: 5-(carboxyamino)imidazole ribonucleotide mutase [Acidobacteriota bacterium]RPJ80044.1 MAG: 5-(carboxyamino)imidazole ribonucleotide mutase [Acidobacteriota bacterium]